MKQESKYSFLMTYLLHHTEDTFTVSFHEIEKIIEQPLPTSAFLTQAWWSNRKVGGVQAQAWLSANFRVVHVDLQDRQVTFSRQSTKTLTIKPNEDVKWSGSMIEALRRSMHLNQKEFAEKLGVRQQTVSEWENESYRPKRAMSKLLTLIAEQEKSKLS